MTSNRKRRKKKGKEFEEVVGEVAQIMDPTSKVSIGKWVEGPDGRREVDVKIIGSYEGDERKILIECKDFDPKSTGAVGIGYVDALHSKTNDLGFDFSSICSNAGFTEGALLKARRVGIGLISVMKKNDKRIKYEVVEEIFTRKLKVEKLSLSLNGFSEISLDGVKYEDVLFDNLPVGNWVATRIMLMIGVNPIVSGSYKGTYEFLEPLEFIISSGPVMVNKLNFHLELSGGWYSHQVTLDATSGLYDWLRHKFRLAPIPGELLIKGLNLCAGTPIKSLSDQEINEFNKISKGEVDLKICLLEGIGEPEPAPNLAPHVKPSDLDPIIPELPPVSYISSQ